MLLEQSMVRRSSGWYDREQESSGCYFSSPRHDFNRTLTSSSQKEMMNGAGRHPFCLRNILLKTELCKGMMRDVRIQRTLFVCSA